MAKSLQDSKAALERHRNDDVNVRVLEKEKELNDLLSQLETNEQKLNTLAEQLQSTNDTGAEAEEPTFEMDPETRRKLEEIDQEAHQGESDLVKQVLKDCEEFKKLQQEVEEEKEIERKRALEEIAIKAKDDDEKYRAQLEDIKNYQITEPSNPQQEEETEQEQEKRKVRE